MPLGTPSRFPHRPMPDSQIVPRCFQIYLPNHTATPGAFALSILGIPSQPSYTPVQMPCSCHRLGQRQYSHFISQSPLRAQVGPHRAHTRPHRAHTRAHTRPRSHTRPHRAHTRATQGPTQGLTGDHTRPHSPHGRTRPPRRGFYPERRGGTNVSSPNVWFLKV